jgi:DNA-binding CsgD family transcriptional regulator
MNINQKEKKMIDDLSYGLSSKDICKKSKLTMATVETYRTRMLKKFGAKNAVELVAMAFRAGVISCLILLMVGCNQKLYDGMKKREPNKEVGR